MDSEVRKEATVMLGTKLNTIALLPDVYSASLVFHAIDAS
jgi:nitrate reductase NapAB chaperone NapD